MEKNIRSRALTLGILFTLFFTGIILRLYWVQIIESPWLVKKAQAKWEEDQVLPAKRGIITDRNGKSLAEDGPGYIVTLNPKVLQAKGLDHDVAKGLADILLPFSDSNDAGKLESKIYDMATKKKANSDELLSEVEVRKEGYQIDAETKQKIDELIKELQVKIELKNKETGQKLDTKNVGIGLRETTRRYYPFNRLASQVLGYLDKEGKPNYGLESALNDYLKGTDGKLVRESDRYGVDLPNGKVTFTPAQDGKNVQLTIDENLQYMLESALKKSYDKWNPRGMMAIAADPKTMEILAMANMPDFDPNRYWATDNVSAFRNNAVSYTYEPGSTFKVVTLAGAIQENLFKPNDTYKSGTISVPGRTLHDHNDVGWGRISYMEGLLRSSNVAFVKLGYEMLGPEKLTDYISRFGFGQPTGIDLPGETSGSIPMHYPAEFATATYGQGLTVTAIQQLASYGAIANEGKLMKPYVVKEIDDPNTHEVVKKTEPQLVRQVVSPETAKQTALDLEQVVANQEMGTGRRAYIEGYRVAGKTGTANIVLPGDNKYADGKWLISFAGFAPVDDPKIVVVVIADIPKLESYHEGGEVAPPVFKEFVSEALSYMGVTTAATPAKMSHFESTVKVPDASGLAISAAKTTIGEAGLKTEVIGSGDQVLKQLPAPGTEVSPTQHVYLMTQEGETPDVPDLAGKSLRDALEVCSLMNIKCKTDGEGYVVSQTVSGDASSREVALVLKPAEELAAQPAADSTGDGDATNKSSDKASDKSGAAAPAKPPSKSTAKENRTASTKTPTSGTSPPGGGSKSGAATGTKTAKKP